MTFPILAGLRVRLPLAPSENPDEVGVVRCADGHEVFTVNTAGSWPNATAHAVAAFLVARINADAPRTPAESAEVLRSALGSIRAILNSVAEESEAAMAAFQVAEDALAEVVPLQAPEPSA
ncbi:hypothetical protein [Methylobacterium sp. WSM2598]|uniref:hypothetical protein n=1 Tax=Methylobacterium sp. WSM2598 TaxID=398261 RepID=UPI000379AD13|nr:hypothetical protein [Methylobacterium sp. WSM2598]